MSAHTLLTVSHVIILVGVLLTGLGGFGTYFFGKKADAQKANAVAANELRLSNKIDSLSTQLGSFEAIALKLYPDLSKDQAIEKLKNDYEQLRKDVDVHKNTLRNLSSQLKVTFSGTWESNPYPAQLFSPVNNEYYVVLANGSRSIEFYASEVYKFTTLGKNKALFSSLQNVKDGSFPLGQEISSLSSYSQINIFVPFFLGDRIEERKITIEKIELVFAVNGIESNPLVVEKHHEINLEKKGNMYWASIGMGIDPSTTKELFQKKVGELRPNVQP